MPNALKIEIKDIPDVGEILDRQRRPMLEAGRLALTDRLARNFERKDQAGNARGWPHSRFWERVASSVTSAAGDDGFSATITEPGVRLRWKGGEVRPREGKKALAIPVDPSVARIWPSEYGGYATGGDYDEGATSLFWPKNSSHGFIKDNETGDILWMLVAKTTHKPDPSVIPSEDELRGAIVRAMRRAWRAAQ